MAQITGGLVSVEDSKPHSNDEYGRKKVRVDLSFAVGDGENYETTFDLASEAASNRVTALLSGVSLRVVAAASTPAAEPTPETPKTRVRRTKAQIAADEAAAAAKATGEELPDDPTNGEEHVIHLPDESDELPDEGDGDDGTGLEDDFTVQPEEPKDEPKQISDADLNAAVQRKNADLQAPDLIRKLIGEYNPDPKQVFQLRQIPAAKRAEFLTKLGALKKAG